MNQLEKIKRKFNLDPRPETCIRYLVELLRENQEVEFSEFPIHILMNKKVEDFIIYNEIKPVGFDATDSYKDWPPNKIILASYIRYSDNELKIATYFAYAEYWKIGRHPRFDNLFIHILPVRDLYSNRIPVIMTFPLENEGYVENKAAAYRMNIIDHARKNNYGLMYLNPELKKYQWMIMDLDKKIRPVDELPSRSAWALPNYGDPYYPWGEDTCPHMHVNKDDNEIEGIHYFGSLDAAKKEVDKILNDDTNLPIRYV